MTKNNDRGLIRVFMHFPGSKNTCFYALEKKIGNENRVPSILGLRLKVTVNLLIYPFFDNTKFTFFFVPILSNTVFKQIRELYKCF